MSPGSALLSACATAHRELAAVGHQQRLRLWVVLGLRQQVRGDEIRARGRHSAITSTSEGPAGRSQAAPSGSFATSCLAAVTQAFPGPKILSTRGMLCVP